MSHFFFFTIQNLLNCQMVFADKIEDILEKKEVRSVKFKYQLNHFTLNRGFNGKSKQPQIQQTHLHMQRWP